MKPSWQLDFDTQGHDYSQKVISAPLNDRFRSLRWSLSVAEVEPK